MRSPPPEGTQARAERESKPWLRDAREAASAREKLHALREEREGLKARFAMLAEGESRLREIEELPTLVEEWLRDLPHLVDRMPIVREYEIVPPEPTDDGPLPVYALTPERIRYLDEEEEVAVRRREADAARGARFRELYAMLGLRVEVHTDGTLDIMVGATNKKGVMPCNEPD